MQFSIVKDNGIVYAYKKNDLFLTKTEFHIKAMLFKKVIYQTIICLFTILSLNCFAANTPEKTSENQQTEIKQKWSAESKKIIDQFNSKKKKTNSATKINKKQNNELSLSRIIVGVITVAGIFIVLLVILKKYGKKFGVANYSNIIKIKARQQIDTKNAIIVAKIYEDEYILGSGNNGVSLIAKLMPIENSELLNDPDNLAEYNNQPFEEQLRNLAEQSVNVKLSKTYKKEEKA